MPQRILQTVRERLNRNLSIAHLALVVAAWIRYVRGTDEAGKAIDVRDPFAADLKAAIGRASNSAGEVRAALSFTAIFGDLSKDARFAVAVVEALTNGCKPKARGAPPLHGNGNEPDGTSVMEQTS